MFERGKVEAVTGAADTVVEYVDPLVKDEKLRERLLAAVAAAAVARRRARREVGITGYLRRLGSDPVLRAQLVELVSQLGAAKKRARKVRSHKLRNTTLVIGGAGLVIVLAPPVRGALLRGRRDEWGEATWPESPPPAPAASDGADAPSS